MHVAFERLGEVVQTRGLNLQCMHLISRSGLLLANLTCAVMLWCLTLSQWWFAS